MDGGFKLIERLDEQCASTEAALGNALAVVQPAPAAARSPYPPAAELPTLQGPAGIRFDFNHGARILCRTGRRAGGASGSVTSTPATCCSKARTRAPS